MRYVTKRWAIAPALIGVMLVAAACSDDEPADGGCKTIGEPSPRNRLPASRRSSGYAVNDSQLSRTRFAH